MYTLTSFRRRISSGDQQVEVNLPAGQVRWLDAQEHAGENIGDTTTHVIFVELKGGAGQATGAIGPTAR
jgi:hypothetical protein